MTLRIGAPMTEQAVSHRLFGCNMEITRRAFWQGISAQMAANRKFYMPDGWQTQGDATYYAPPQNPVCKGGYWHLCDASLGQTHDGCVSQSGRRYRFAVWAAGKGALAVFWGGQIICEVKNLDRSPRRFETVFTAECDGVQPLTLSVQGEADVYVVSLLPEDAVFGCRRDVCERLRDLQPAQLRFPGGCYAEVYRWKDGLLPVDERPPVTPDLYDRDFVLRDSYGYDCHEMGTDEFMALCRFVGAEPVITAPILRESAEDAADWVSYCNDPADAAWGALRAARGQAEPYAVHEWYIGNEPYYFGGELARDGDAAGRRAAQHFAAMRERDASIRAVVSFCVHNLAWSEAALRHAPEGALLSHHFYGTNELDARQTDLLDVIDALFLPELRLTVETAQRTGRTWDITVDEWAYDWGHRGHTLSAVVEALIGNFLVSEGWRYGVKSALYFHPINEGLIAVTPTGCSLDTGGVVWQMLLAHRGGLPCAVDGLPSGVSAAATRHGDGSLCVTLVNRGREAVTLCVQGFDGARYRVWKPLSVDARQTQAVVETGILTDSEITLPTGAVMLLICG